MIAAAMLCGTPSVLLEGSAISPADRLPAAIGRHHVSVLKVGSTFLRMLMTASPASHGGGAAVLARHSLASLRLVSFCAEPLNEVVHRFAVVHLAPHCFNSYWATEHGAIVWSRWSNQQTVRADTKCWPLPWIDGDVIVRTDSAEEWRPAADGEQGDVLIRNHTPYHALTVWQSKGFGSTEWCGDLQRWRAYFVSGMGYMQGDAAVRHADGAYTFHGRSDEVR